MKLFIKILLCGFVALVTNVKVVNASITFPNTKELTMFFSFNNETPKALYNVIENDLANCCENEQNLVAYRSWGISIVGNAAKWGMGLAEDFLSSTTKSWGDQGLTVAGRALQKHAGREGSVFQSIKFSHKTANQDALNIINQIKGSKNQMIQQAENGGKLIFDKTTGMVFGVSREGLFNGFRELGK